MAGSNCGRNTGPGDSDTGILDGGNPGSHWQRQVTGTFRAESEPRLRVAAPSA